jgi:hypothetical protein
MVQWTVHKGVDKRSPTLRENNQAQIKVEPGNTQVFRNVRRALLEQAFGLLHEQATICGPEPSKEMLPDQSRRFPHVPRLADLSKGEAPLA